MTNSHQLSPLVSVIVVNYNCKRWLENFFTSLQSQTIFDRVEIIIVDNTSTDGSAEICERQMAAWPNGVFLATGGNFGFGGGNNRGAAIARGKYFFFVNPDVRLEPNCLEKFVEESETNGFKIASPLILDYDSNNIQGQGAAGFDIFGCMVAPRANEHPRQLFAVATFFFIRHDLFQKVGGFDNEFFLFSEELDLSWRAWMAGESITLISSARVHHQFASNQENRTSDAKRFYANRSHLLTLLKNSQGPLLWLAFSQLALIAVEAVVGSILSRRFSFIHWALLKPVADCWRLRRHILEQRQKNHAFRRHGDMWIFNRFFCLRFGRWNDVRRLLKYGVKIDKC